VESFNIVVTNQRMIFAQMTPQMIKDEAAKNRGGGVGGFFKAMTSGYTLWQRYLQMPPDMALQETPGNFVVYLNQIRKVKFSGDKVLFSKGGVSVGLHVGVGGHDDDKPTKLEIETTGVKYSFDIIMQFQQQTHQVLKGAGLIR